MGKIAIVTDSVACVSEELLQKYDIRVAAVQIIWDKVKYRDGVDLKTAEFYRRLRTSKTLPTTSSGIAGEFIQIFEDLKRKKVDGIVAVVLTGALGAAYNSAMTAKDMISDVPIEVIDTRTAMMAQGFAVLAAAKVAAAGGSMANVAKAARDTASKTHIFWAMDTLEYLRKGGRVSLPQAVFASWLQVKPITGINNGKVEPLARVRTKAKVMDKLIEMMGERVSGTSPLHVAIMHGDAMKEAEKLEKMVAAKYNPIELMRSEITPVIGTHTGPGTLGLAFYNE